MDDEIFTCVIFVHLVLLSDGTIVMLHDVC